MLESLLDRYNLPNQTHYTEQDLFEAALHDKKRSGGEITIVIPTALGKSELMTIPVEALHDWIETGVTP